MSESKFASVLWCRGRNFRWRNFRRRNFRRRNFRRLKFRQTEFSLNTTPWSFQKFVLGYIQRTLLWSNISNIKFSSCINYTRPSVTHMGHATIKLLIISPTIREAFGASLLAVIAELVCRIPTTSKVSLGNHIELVYYVNMGHTCVHWYLKYYCHGLQYMPKMWNTF